MKKKRHHPIADLFGEIVVTWPEVWAWVFEATGLTPDHWRAHYYVRQWRVAEKIKEAKMRQYDDAQRIQRNRR